MKKLVIILGSLMAIALFVTILPTKSCAGYDNEACSESPTITPIVVSLTPVVSEVVVTESYSPTAGGSATPTITPMTTSSPTATSIPGPTATPGPGPTATPAPAQVPAAAPSTGRG